MAETARRRSGVLGTDAARRLIARPIRRHLSEGASAAPREAPPAAPIQDADAPAAQDALAASDLTRKLESQILVMKAVIQAERRENETLRACVGLDGEDETLGEEARAVRDRWASLVDRLLHSSL